MFYEEGSEINTCFCCKTLIVTRNCSRKPHRATFSTSSDQSSYLLFSDFARMFIPLQLSDNEVQLDHSTGMHNLPESDLAM